MTDKYSYIHFQNGTKIGWADIRSSQIEPQLDRHLRFRISNPATARDTQEVSAALTFYHDSWISDLGALVHLDDSTGEDPLKKLLEHHNITFGHSKDSLSDILKVSVAPIIFRGFDLAIIALFDPRTQEASFACVYIRSPDEVFRDEQLSEVGEALLSLEFVAYSGGDNKHHFMQQQAELATTIATFAEHKST